jgi:hypothetical protein
MYYAVFKGTSKYVALAKNEPFVTNPPDAMWEPGDVWFEFGATAEEALVQLKASLVIEGHKDIETEN